MNKLVTLAAAVGASVLALAGAGSAQASPNGAFSGPMGDHDAEAMWVDVQPFDPSATIPGAATFAQSLCEGLRSGMSEGSVIVVGTHNGFSVSSARFLLHAAEWHYCPEYY